jgi:hypothetical protein
LLSIGLLLFLNRKTEKKGTRQNEISINKAKSVHVRYMSSE